MGFRLFKKGNIYHLRVYVPSELQKLLKRTKLKKSLKMGMKSVAKLTASGLIYRTSTAFMRIQTGMLTSTQLENITTSLLAEFSSTVEKARQDRKTDYDSDTAFLDIVLPYDPNTPDTMTQLNGSFRYPRTIIDITKAVSLYNDEVAKLESQRATGDYSGAYIEYICWYIDNKNIDVAIPSDELLKIPDDDVEYWGRGGKPHFSTEFTAVCDAVCDGLIESYRLEIERIQGRRDVVREAAILARIESAKHRPKLSELWEAYRQYKSAKGESTATGYERFYNDTVKILGDKELSAYSQDDAIKLLGSLKQNSASTATGKIEFVSRRSGLYT